MRIINEIDFLFPLKRSSLFKMLLLDTRRWEKGHPCIIFVCDPRIMFFFLFTMSCGCKKILTSAVAFVFFFPRYHFHSVLFQFCAAIISCATDWKGWKCLISYLGLFCFFKHYNLDHKVRNSLDEVFVLRVIPLYDFSSLQTFKNSLHGRMPLKAPCSETDVLGGRGGDAGQPSCKDHKGKVCLHDFSCLVQVSTC